MTQSNFGTIDPYTKTGLALATDLNAWRTAVHSLHSGTATPSYAPAGMNWMKTTAFPWLWSVYDGVDNITIQQVDPSTDLAMIDGQQVYVPAATYAGVAASDLWYDHTLEGFRLQGTDTAQPLLQRDWEFIARSQYSGVATAGFNILNLGSFRTLRLQIFVHSPDGAQLQLKTSIDNGVSWPVDTGYETLYEGANSLAAGIYHDEIPQGAANYVYLGLGSSGTGYISRQFYNIELYEFNQARVLQGHYTGGMLSGDPQIWGIEMQMGSFRRYQATARNALQIVAVSPFMTKFWYHIEGIRS